MELLLRKLDKRFRLFDADGDGYLIKSDVDRAARACLGHFGESVGTPKGRDVMAAYASLWNALVHNLDTDNDGQVSFEELARYVTAAEFQEGTGYELTFGRIAESVLALCDTDGNGTISFPEFRAIPGIAGLGENEAREAFERLDTDGSGYLDITELHAAQRAFYTSTDPSHPGNLLFGQV
jgi:Ca2+-binding EF-hand superfamily protein